MADFVFLAASAAPSSMPYVWLILLVFFGLLEAFTAGLASIWFALGALVALLAASLGSPLWLQIVWFLLVSGLTLAGLRPVAKKYLVLKSTPTNADRALGQSGVVLDKIDNMAARGQVSVGGRVWTARSADGQVIEKGAAVRSLRIEGVKLIVEEEKSGPAEARPAPQENMPE